MIHPSRLITLSLLIWGLIISPCHAQTHDNNQIKDKIKVAYVEFPPIEFKNKDGAPSGTLINITKMVLDNAGLDYEFIYLPIARAYLYIKEGNVDLWPGLIGIPSLQGRVLESKSIPGSITLSAFYLKGTPPLSNVQQLSGTDTILINGYTYAGLINRLTKPSFKMKALFTPSHESGLKMLQLRRGDYFLDYNEPVYAYLKDNPMDNIEHSVLNKRYASFIVSKKHPNAKQLLNKLDQSYEQLLNNKTIIPTISNHTQ